MKVLLLGAKGMLGRAVQATMPAHVALDACDLDDFDITDELQVRRALERMPDWVINCAAYTAVDAAQTHEAEATRINGDAVGIVGRAAAGVGARVLHISTDYVFDGTLGRPYRETDDTNPQGAYGRSKLAGERQLAASGCRWVLVRTQWLYGGGPSFVRTMWQRAKQGAPSRVVADQRGAPTHVRELAGVIWRLVGEKAGGAEGIWHAAAGGEATWFEVARAVYSAAGADPKLVTPCTTAEHGSLAPRPADGRLACRIPGGMRPWDVVLAETLGPGLGGGGNSSGELP